MIMQSDVKIDVAIPGHSSSVKALLRCTAAASIMKTFIRLIMLHKRRTLNETQYRKDRGSLQQKKTDTSTKYNKVELPLFMQCNSVPKVPQNENKKTG